VLTLAPERGTIVDREGAALAISVGAPSVYAIPSEIKQVDRTARQLARVLGIDARALAARLRDHPGFLFLARWVSPQRAERVSNLKLPGVDVLHEPRRTYPHRELAAQIVGFANIDGVGVRGIEQQEDDWLRGTARSLPAERDARGRLLISVGEQQWNSAGGDIALTLDAALQAEAEAALGEAIEETGARGGVVISMDPRSGDILALAEAPRFDPNRFRELEYEATRSRAFLDAAEPGSTLKAFLVAAALETQAVTAEQRFDCEDGSFRIPGKTIRDTHPHGVLSTAEILRVSSNIGATKIARVLGAHAHYEMLRRFGFGESTQSRFPDESAGVLRPWRRWTGVDHATIAFGQGVGVTPIQLAAATAALANGGDWVRPRLVAARRAAGGPWRPTEWERVRRVLRPETAAAVLAMLERSASSEGTGRQATLRGVRVAGKTGTAQKFDPESGRYAQDRFRTWFIGAVPADDPELRMVIVTGLDEPRRPSHTAGATAAPLFARVAAAQLSRFGISTAPQHTWPRSVPTQVARVARGSASGPAPAALAPVSAAAPVVESKKTDPAAPGSAAPAAGGSKTVAPGAVAPSGGAPTKPAPKTAFELARLSDRVLLPDFLGLTVAEVKQMTAGGDFDLQISGRGRAVEQDPPPGTVVAGREARVHVRFAPHSGDREGEG
jgi:cell division protein FtsI (penicillin-binding protein 3)